MHEALLQREKWLIISVLVALSIMAWGFTVYQARMDMSMGPSTMAFEAVLFLLMWLSMMIAMMFPSVYPMVLFYARVSKGQPSHSEAAGVPTWIFVAGYLAIWTLFGIFVYPAFLAMRWLGGYVAWIGDHAPLISGIVLIGAGLYQFSRWKSVCLTHCRSPLSFILHRWREGAGGAFRMGIDHGSYCVGCCWGLMVVLVAVGLMNLAWMGLLTVAIFMEKVSHYGAVLSKLIGGVLILLGIVMLLNPRLIPGFLA